MKFFLSFHPFLFCIAFTIFSIDSTSSFNSKWKNLDGGSAKSQKMRSNNLAVPQPQISSLTSIEELNSLMERHFASNNTIEPSSWESSLPTAKEILEMQSLVEKLLDFEDFNALPNNFLTEFFPELNKSLDLTVLMSGEFCVIHEKFTSEGSQWLFPRYWGYAVIRSKSSTLRPIHHSAAHFESDGPVIWQAAVIFEKTASRTLCVAGANRYAVKRKVTSQCQSHNFAADAAHNNRTMFHVINSSIYKALRAKSKHRLFKKAVKEPENFFIQWHGMDETSCQNISAFLSAGTKSPHWTYSTFNSTINKLVREIVSASSGKFSAATPLTLSTCRLVAETNVFGRIVNGVFPARVCDQRAESENVRGEFIHIEQKALARNKPRYWNIAIEKVFKSKAKVH